MENTQFNGAKKVAPESPFAAHQHLELDSTENLQQGLAVQEGEPLPLNQDTPSTVCADTPYLTPSAANLVTASRLTAFSPFAHFTSEPLSSSSTTASPQSSNISPLNSTQSPVTDGSSISVSQGMSLAPHEATILEGEEESQIAAEAEELLATNSDPLAIIENSSITLTRVVRGATAPSPFLEGGPTFAAPSASILRPASTGALHHLDTVHEGRGEGRSTSEEVSTPHTPEFSWMRPHHHHHHQGRKTTAPRSRSSFDAEMDKQTSTTTTTTTNILRSSSTPMLAPTSALRQYPNSGANTTASRLPSPPTYSPVRNSRNSYSYHPSGIPRHFSPSGGGGGGTSISSRHHSDTPPPSPPEAGSAASYIQSSPDQVHTAAMNALREQANLNSNSPYLLSPRTSVDGLSKQSTVSPRPSYDESPLSTPTSVPSPAMAHMNYINMFYGPPPPPYYEQRSDSLTTTQLGTYSGSADRFSGSSVPALGRPCVGGGGPAVGGVPLLPWAFPAARYSVSVDTYGGNAPGDATFHRQSGGDGNNNNNNNNIISDSAASMLRRLQLSANHGFPKVRALLHTGGVFRDARYEGGEVRLISLPEGCSFAELIAVLAKTDRPPPSSTSTTTTPTTNTTNVSSSTTSRSLTTTRPITGANSGGGVATAAAAALIFAQHAAGPDHAGTVGRVHCILLYQLPSDPALFVDIIDDEDVTLMFEEMAEIKAFQGPTAPKFHLYVQWMAPLHVVEEQQQRQHTAAAVVVEEMNESQLPPPPLPPVFSGVIFGSSSSLNTAGDCVVEEHRENHVQSGLRELRLASIRTDQLEVIPAAEVTLQELLGTGAFGDMYRGTWCESTVAVKCLSPVGIGLQFQSKAAWLDFLADANSSAALRHPHLVEVYGIVLPGEEYYPPNTRKKHQNHNAQQQRYLSHSAENQHLHQHGIKMSGRSISWDFNASLKTNIADLTPSMNPPTAYESTSRCQQIPGPVACPPALVMEYVRGRSLRGAISRGDDSVAGFLTRIIYALDITRALVYLHQRGMVHFDLKSSNVLLGWKNMRPAAKVFFAGYGLKVRRETLSTYTPGVTMSHGVFPWLAPETYRTNAPPVSHKADVYSLGIILWELWAMRAPYEHDALNNAIFLACTTNEEVRPQFPPGNGAVEPAVGWGNLVQRCWAEDPEQRPESVEIEKELKVMARAVKNAQLQMKRAAEEVVTVVVGGGDGDKSDKGGKKEEEEGLNA